MKAYSIVIAGGGSTFTPGIVLMLLEHVKLPGSFFISTPVGKYNPDWAIAFHEGTVKHIYFIAETKGTTLLDRNELRGVEDLKIQCAKAHFAAISNDSVVYDVVDSYDKLMQVVME